MTTSEPTDLRTFAAVILAGGAASRMGRVKQLLPYGSGCLLGHAIDQAAAAGFAPVVVVVGAHAEAIREAIAAMPVEIAVNDAWQKGMGSSIAAGVKRLTAPVFGVALLTGDQPLVMAQHLMAMRDLLQAGVSDAVAAEYDGTLGIPAIFKGEFLERLAQLPPAAGAKALLQDPALRVSGFPLPEAAADLDTPEDWARLVKL